MTISSGTPADAQRWADAVFHDPPRWVAGLLLAREALVGLVGIERADGAAFEIVQWAADEVLLGIDQRHLSFRASVLRTPTRVVVTTVVQIHNRRGQVYSTMVRRVHPHVVRAMLRRAAATLQVAA